jgi:hypothetical protein
MTIEGNAVGDWLSLTRTLLQAFTLGLNLEKPVANYHYLNKNDGVHLLREPRYERGHSNMASYWQRE